MASGAQNATIEGFVTDVAFTDQSKNISDLFPSSTANVGELSSNALSYFSTPAAIVDKRIPADRTVNWAAQTRPRIVMDEDAYAVFMANMAALPVTSLNQLFRVVDKLIFNYQPNQTHAQIETTLTTSADTKDIYVAGSFAISGSIITDTVYVDGVAPKTIPVPAYATFDIQIPSGSTTKTYSLKIYTGINAFLTEYSHSTIAEVIPPLPYNRLFEDSILTSKDNVFSIASLSADLAYNTMQATLKNKSVSGMVPFRAVLQDSSNNVGVPFNILYRGRTPTLFEIRNAIKDELLSSGIGDAVTWQKRIPGVFVSGRFYVVPFWSKVFPKPDQNIFPNVLTFNGMSDVTGKVLSTLGYGDITEYMDVISIYYNHMTASAVPDLSGTVDFKRLIEVVPDYQSYSPTDEQFVYMQDDTKAFTRELNTVLAIASNAQTSSVYGPNTEGLLSFYSFTAGNYEVCVITRSCYEAILESEQ